MGVVEVVQGQVWTVLVVYMTLGLPTIHTAMAEVEAPPQRAPAAGGNITLAFDQGEVEPGWRNNLLIITSLALVIGAAITMVYCCCRSCNEGAAGTQATGPDPTGQAPAAGLVRNASFFRPPPRYSAIVRSQSQRRARLNALERAAITSLPRYNEAVKQLEEEEEKEQQQEVITDMLRPREDQPEVTTEVTETLLTISASTGNLATATLVDETLATSGNRPLFHSADSLLAAETAVALEDETDIPFGQQMAARSASCSDLLDMDRPESYHALLRKKVIAIRPDSLPPRYSELLEKSQPKSKAPSHIVNSTDV